MADSPSHPFHWPGGIPAEVKSHPTGDFTPGEVDEEVKGWLLFVTVKPQFYSRFPQLCNSTMFLTGLVRVDVLAKAMVEAAVNGNQKMTFENAEIQVAG
jgi:hypothetical protein